MDEERDGNKGELKPHETEEVKVEPSVIPPVIGQPDVTPLHHISDSDRRFSHKNNENKSVDARHLDSVYQYTSKIRQFIGLVDTNEDKPVPVSAPESEVEKVTSDDASDTSVEESDDAKKNLTDLNRDKNDADHPSVDKGDDIEGKLTNLTDQDKNGSGLTKPALDNETDQLTTNERDVENVQKESQPIGIVDAEIPKVDNSGSSVIEDSDEIPDNDEQKNSLNERNEKILTDDDLTLPDTDSGDNSSELKEVSLPDTESGANPPELKKVSLPDTESGANPSELKEVNLPDTESGDNPSKLKEVNVPDTKAGDSSTELKEVSQPDTEAEDQSTLKEGPDLDKDSDMTAQISENKMNSPLLEPDENNPFNSGVDLTKPENILKDEEIEESPDSNIPTLENQEQIPVSSDEIEISKMLEEPNKLSNGDEQNISSNEDTYPMSSELNAIDEEQDCRATAEEIEQTPHFEDIRRLSVEIVNKVLDTAGTQLRDILNEKRKSNADANNLLERSSNSENVPISNEATVKASNVESVNASYDQDKNNLVMNEGDSPPSSEQPEGKHKLNNEIQLKEVLAKTYDLNDFQKKIEVEMNKFELYDVDKKHDIDPDIVCGIGCFKPRWIQPWATSRVYLVLYSIIGILSGSYYSYLIGAMSTLEKRFAFKSKTSGFVMMLDEITPLILGIFIGYFGGKSHRPRMVGLGMVLSSICCFISALPYFIYGPATHLSLGYSEIDNEKKLELCNTEEREVFCDDEDRLPTLTPVLLLMLGSFLKGFGNLAYYAVGLAYMDDNAKKKNTPMYFAVAFSLRLLGPMVGFLMSSFFLKYYENPFVDPGFGPSDPRWIGCWWMGFLVQGVLLMIFTVPISLFPRRLPGTVDYSKSEDNQHLVTSFVGLFAALKRLAKNPVYCLLVLNVICGIFGSFGHYINLPRYMENQFRLSASISSLISGPPSIGAVMISMTTGGYLIWRYKPGARFLSAALCASELLQVCAYLILMIPKCNRVEMTSYGFNNDGLNLQSECNSNCNCTTSAFSPVCGPDGATMFFSPCHAGCSEKVNGTYLNCSCVFDSSGQQRDYVTNGFCMVEDCWPGIIAYILTMPVVQLIVSLSKVGHTMIFLRSIKPEDKSVALGTFETFICLLGFIPYPVVYGALVDSACLIWEKSCGETGNCWYYDVPKLNYVLHGTSALFSTFDALTLFGIFLLASRVPNLYKEDYETEDKPSARKNEVEPQGQRKDSNSSTKL